MRIIVFGRQKVILFFRTRYESIRLDTIGQFAHFYFLTEFRFCFGQFCCRLRLHKLVHHCCFLMLVASAFSSHKKLKFLFSILSKYLQVSEAKSGFVKNTFIAGDQNYFFMFLPIQKTNMFLLIREMKGHHFTGTESVRTCSCSNTVNMSLKYFW